MPNIPSWPGMDKFRGAVYHSNFHRDAEKWAGKKAIVVGAVSTTIHFYPVVFISSLCSAMPQLTSRNPSFRLIIQLHR